MATTFADLFEAALAEKKLTDPKYGLRTLARELADEDREQTEFIRRRLNKYRNPRDGSGAAKVKPTAETREDIEDAMGLHRDSLKPVVDPAAAAAQKLQADVMGMLVELVAERLATRAPAVGVA